MNSQERHDFLNNGIRIEILNKLVCEAIEENKNIEAEHVDDLISFFQTQIVFLKKIKLKS